MIKELNPVEAQARLQQGALLVDVRERAEIAEFACEVPETLVMPLSEIQARFRELPQDRELILVCAGGGRSLHACRYLAGQGYANASNLYGGVFSWNSLGLPVWRKGNGSEKSVNSCRLW